MISCDIIISTFDSDCPPYTALEFEYDKAQLGRKQTCFGYRCYCSFFFLVVIESSKSTEFMITVGRGKPSKERIITAALLVVAVIVLTVGIALIAAAASDKKTDKKSDSTSKQGGEGKATTTVPPTTEAPSSRCDFSEEAQKVGLVEFLDRVEATYYKLHPYDVHYDPDVTTDRVKTEYVGYDPTPSVIKTRTDTALALLKEISEKEVDTDKLKPRERKALAQVKHHLQHVFGKPYDVNYYAGDWMMGPNLFCWQEICYHGYAVYNGIGLYLKPYNAEDVKLIESKLKTHKEGILQYIENMKMGVRRGMIRSEEECQAGIDAIKGAYLFTSRYNETGEIPLLVYLFILCTVLLFHIFPNGF